jgi:hypothetical protein
MTTAKKRKCCAQYRNAALLADDGRQINTCPACGAELHGAPGAGQVCGAANSCTRLRRHTGQHANLYTGNRW